MQLLPLYHPCISGVIYPKRQLYLLVYCLIQESGKSYYELSKVYHSIIVRVKYPKQVLSVETVSHSNALTEFLLVYDPIVNLGLAQLVEVQVQIIDLFSCES